MAESIVLSHSHGYVVTCRDVAGFRFSVIGMCECTMFEMKFVDIIYVSSV